MPPDQNSLRIGLIVFAFLWAISSIGVQLQMGRLEDRLVAKIETVRQSVDQKH